MDLDNVRTDFLVDVDFDIDYVDRDETIKEDLYLKNHSQKK